MYFGQFSRAPWPEWKQTLKNSTKHVEQQIFKMNFFFTPYSTIYLKRPAVSPDRLESKLVEEAVEGACEHGGFVSIHVDRQ